MQGFSLGVYSRFHRCFIININILNMPSITSKIVSVYSSAPKPIRVVMALASGLFAGCVVFIAIQGIAFIILGNDRTSGAEVSSSLGETSEFTLTSWPTYAPSAVPNDDIMYTPNSDGHNHHHYNESLSEPPSAIELRSFIPTNAPTVQASYRSLNPVADESLDTEASEEPTSAPVLISLPSTLPSIISMAPTGQPSLTSTQDPTLSPSMDSLEIDASKVPTLAPLPSIITTTPTVQPSLTSSQDPTLSPSMESLEIEASKEPTSAPLLISLPSTLPSIISTTPTRLPSSASSLDPTLSPSLESLEIDASEEPTMAPVLISLPSTLPSIISAAPTRQSSSTSSLGPTLSPSLESLEIEASEDPTSAPILQNYPTFTPSLSTHFLTPSKTLSLNPFIAPSLPPTTTPSSTPSSLPTDNFSIISFVATVDTPESRYNNLREELKSIDKDTNDFFIHMGDMRKAKNSECVESVYSDVAAIMIESPIPVYVTPGKNDWATCDDPFDALEDWKSSFVGFEKNWEHQIPVVRRQESRKENFAFVEKEVLFIGLHLVDGINKKNFGDEHKIIKESLLLDAKKFTNDQMNMSADASALVIFSHAKNHKHFYEFYKGLQEDFTNIMPNRSVLFIHVGKKHFEVSREDNVTIVHLNIDSEDMLFTEFIIDVRESDPFMINLPGPDKIN